jgi:hypothetical protein
MKPARAHGLSTRTSSQVVFELPRCYLRRAVLVIPDSPKSVVVVVEGKLLLRARSVNDFITPHLQIRFSRNHDGTAGLVHIVFDTATNLQHVRNSQAA